MSDLVSGVERLLVGDVTVDDQSMTAGSQHVGPHDGDVVPATVIDGRRRVDDDRPRSVARVPHVAWPTVNQFD